MAPSGPLRTRGRAIWRYWQPLFVSVASTFEGTAFGNVAGRIASKALGADDAESEGHVVVGSFAEYAVYLGPVGVEGTTEAVDVGRHAATRDVRRCDAEQWDLRVRRSRGRNVRPRERADLRTFAPRYFASVQHGASPK
jgi:hypothetical protein